MENLYEKPKNAPKLENTSLYGETQPLDANKVLKDASVNPKVNPKDLSSEIKETSLYNQVTPKKDDKLNNLYKTPEIKPEDLKNKNVNKPISKAEVIESIGKIDTTIKTTVPASLTNVNSKVADKKEITDLGNVNTPKTK